MRSFTSIVALAWVGVAMVAAPASAQQPATGQQPAAAQQPAEKPPAGRNAEVRAARLAVHGQRQARHGRRLEQRSVVEQHRARALRASGQVRAARAEHRQAVRSAVRGARAERRGRARQAAALKIHRRAAAAADSARGN